MEKVFQLRLIGKGMPVFSPDTFELPLVLQKVETLSAGRVRLSYNVES